MSEVDWQCWILMGVIWILVTVCGLVWIFAWNGLKSRREQINRRFVEKVLIPRVKTIVVETMSECLELLPEKILEAKKAIDGE